MPTTPNGTPYSTYMVSSTPTLGATLYGVADAVKDARAIPTILYTHGNGGAYNQFNTTPAWAEFRNWLIDNGWAWVEGRGGGPTSWGNTAARDDYRNSFEWASSQIDIGDVVILGRSMLGLVAYWLYLYDPVIAPKAVGLIVNSGTTDLAYRFSVATGPDLTNLLAAYDAADSAQFASNSIGHDPMLFPTQDWAGKSVLQCYGTADTEVPPAQHALAWLAKYGADAFRAVDAPRIGGDHTGANGSYHQVAEMVEFMQNVRATTRPVHRIIDAYFVGLDTESYRIDLGQTT